MNLRFCAFLDHVNFIENFFEGGGLMVADPHSLLKIKVRKILVPLRLFHNANLGITKKPMPDFSFYDRSSPIYTQPRYLTPFKMFDADVTDSLIGEGCVIKNCKIHHSIVGLRSYIAKGAVTKDSFLMGEDSYETDADRELLAAKGSVLIEIGKNTHIKRPITDKNARIGDDVK
nr:glucose-1-phosphate adenylyltransferase small subunit, chloroplastic/amyloplastic [Tanacetum cinerariifolium]